MVTKASLQAKIDEDTAWLTKLKEIAAESDLMQAAYATAIAQIEERIAVYTLALQSAG